MKNKTDMFQSKNMRIRKEIYNKNKVILHTHTLTDRRIFPFIHREDFSFYAFKL